MIHKRYREDLALPVTDRYAPENLYRNQSWPVKALRWLRWMPLAPVKAAVYWVRTTDPWWICWGVAYGVAHVQMRNVTRWDDVEAEF